MPHHGEMVPISIPLDKRRLSVLTSRTCRERTKSGEQCRQSPLRDRDACFWHDPEHAETAAEARRLGGLRRRKEGTIVGAYDFQGLESIPEIRRLVEIVVTDALSMENSIARGRLLIAGAQAAAKLLEVGELETRVEALETTLTPRLVKPARRR